MNIIFNGPPGSGKDEACKFLAQKYGFRHLQFKDQLFIETALHFGVSLEWFMHQYDDRELKEKPREELNGLSKREALIHVSENIIKPVHGKDYFGVKTAEKIKPGFHYCFSDGGFVDEVCPLINRVGQQNSCIVQLYRNGYTFSSDSRNYINGIFQEDFGSIYPVTLLKPNPDIPIRMYRIYNNSSVSDFHKAIKTIMKREANANSNTNVLGKSV